MRLDASLGQTKLSLVEIALGLNNMENALYIDEYRIKGRYVPFSKESFVKALKAIAGKGETRLYYLNDPKDISAGVIDLTADDEKFDKYFDNFYRGIPASYKKESRDLKGIMVLQSARLGEYYIKPYLSVGAEKQWIIDWFKTRNKVQKYYDSKSSGEFTGD